jgi:hypothetical protein
MGISGERYASLEPLAALEGSLADVDVFRLLREGIAEARQERDPATVKDLRLEWIAGQ